MANIDCAFEQIACVPVLRTRRRPLEAGPAPIPPPWQYWFVVLDVHTARPVPAALLPSRSQWACRWIWRQLHWLQQHVKTIERFYATSGGFHSILIAKRALPLFLVVSVFTQQVTDG